MDAVIVDLDGTLADRGDRSPYAHAGFVNDAPFPDVVRLVQSLAAAGNAIVIASGRAERTRQESLEWLDRYLAVPLSGFYLRAEEDNRPDAVVKSEMLAEIQESGFRVWLVIDDRDQTVHMWRQHGLTVAQIAYGDF